MTANINGIAAVLERIPGLEHVAQRLARRLRDDAELLAGADHRRRASSASAWSRLIGWWALSRVLARLSGVPDVHKLDAPSTTRQPVGTGARPAARRAFPVRRRRPRRPRAGVADHRRGRARRDHRPQRVGQDDADAAAVGRAADRGHRRAARRRRPRQAGGTAVVMQHPESQVLGTRVADDVVFGLPPGTTTDVDRLLAEVGLDGLAERDTGGLSGGELQRLAVAAALAREPALLIADEVTSMVDQQGREGLIAVLSGLTKNGIGCRWCTSRTTTTRRSRPTGSST